MNRRIVRSQAMRQDTARLIKAALEKKPTTHRFTPTVSVAKGRQDQVPATPQTKAGPNILFTGGIGDFIAIESYMSVIEHNSVRNVYLATRAAKSIKLILESAPIFPKLENIITLQEDWSDVFCVYHLDHLRSEAAKRGWHLGQIPNDIIDYSIWHVFNQIKNGLRVFHPSYLFIHCLADLSQFKLPMEYAFIQPYSPNDRQDGRRDFSREEWDKTLQHLRDKNRTGVVILNSNDYVPDDPMLINLANKTTITQALEIAKRSQEYIGVDSCFAALVTKFLPNDKIIIKTVNDHYKNHLGIYCAPKQDFNFICKHVTEKL
jgi:hypothetical protein